MKGEDGKKQLNDNNLFKTTTKTNIFEPTSTEEIKKEPEPFTSPLKSDEIKIEELDETEDEPDNIIFQQRATLYRYEDAKWSIITQGMTVVLQENDKKRLVFTRENIGIHLLNFFFNFDLCSRVVKDTVKFLAPAKVNEEMKFCVFLLKFRAEENAQKMGDLMKEFKVE